MHTRIVAIFFAMLAAAVACRATNTTTDDGEGAGGGGEGGLTTGVGGGSGGAAEQRAGGGGLAGQAGGGASGASSSNGGTGSGGSAALSHDAGVPDANAPTTLLTLATSLSGQRWELTCGKVVENDQVCENYGAGSKCPDGGLFMLNKTTNFGGSAGTVYDVNIRVRGVVEPRTYSGGQADGKHFYVGGTPSGDNNYNVYSLSVSSPKQTYYFNGDEGQGTGHRVFTIDHKKTIKIEGGAKLTMIAYDSNCSAIRNCVNPGPSCMPYVIPEVPPAPAAWNGQFLQLDVVSVTAP